MTTHKVIVGRPPNFDKIVKVFPLAERASTIFAYGDTIYVSEGTMLPTFLVKHERVHLQRQKEIGVKEWWDKYLEDPKFRYEEEVIAHKAEYWARMRGHNMSIEERKKAAHIVTKRLLAPLYKFDVPYATAYKDITGVDYGSR